MHRIPGLVLLTLAVLFMIARPASAHTELVETRPADAASVESGLETVALTFTREVDARLATVAVRHEGRVISKARPKADAMSLVQPVEDLAPGAYEVDWRAAAADGHVLTGSFAFRVGNPGETSDPRTPAASPAPRKRLTPAELLRQHAEGNYDHDSTPSYAVAADETLADPADDASTEDPPAEIAAAAPPGSARPVDSGAAIITLLVAGLVATAVTAAAESLRRA